MTGGYWGVPPNALLRSPLPVSGRQHDLEFIEFIPLGVGPLSLVDRQKLLQAKTGGTRLRLVHGDIISSFGGDGTLMHPGRRCVGPLQHPPARRRAGRLSAWRDCAG